MNRLIAALTLTVALVLPAHPASAEVKGEPKFPATTIVKATHTVAPIDEARTIRRRTSLIQEARVRRFVYARTVSFAARYEQAKQNEAARVREAREAQVSQHADSHASQPTPVASYGSGACGGSLPPCSVMMCESGGSLTAQNPNSSASGKWQILDSTWAGFGGYSRAMYAPESVQDERARQIYAGGAGRSAWVC